MYCTVRIVVCGTVVCGTVVYGTVVWQGEERRWGGEGILAQICYVMLIASYVLYVPWWVLFWYGMVW